MKKQPPIRLFIESFLRELQRELGYPMDIGKMKAFITWAEGFDWSGEKEKLHRAYSVCKLLFLQDLQHEAKFSGAFLRYVYSMNMSALTSLTSLALSAMLALPMAAQAQQFFRIGTGGTAGTYYPVGGMIANAVSQPGKIIATAQASNGSVANVTGISGGAMESGFSQADVATWAQTGTGIYEGKPNVPGLRLIANLYPESVHVVVKKGSGIKSVADLKGKRVALDEPGSGTLVNARVILAAYGLKESDIKPEYIKPNQAGDKLKDGSLDAFFFTGGAPAGAIAELASAGSGIDILPIEGAQADALRKSSPFFAPDTIAADTYKGVAAVQTLAVGAQWVTSDKADTATVYEITKALFGEAAQKQLAGGHAKGKFITKENAVKGAGIPFHPGAAKFYKEAGLIK